MIGKLTLAAGCLALLVGPAALLAGNGTRGAGQTLRTMLGAGPGTVCPNPDCPEADCPNPDCPNPDCPGTGTQAGNGHQTGPQDGSGPLRDGSCQD